MDEARIVQPLVIVSDIHLIDDEDPRAKILYATIARLDPTRVRYFILLGDIFDFCFGASAYFRRKFSRLGEALSTLAAGGTKVLFFQGNHEFALTELGWQGVEFVCCREKIIAFTPQLHLAFSHGDRLNAPWHYHLYCRITRSWLFKNLARLLPQNYLDRLCLALASKSRSRDRYRRLKHRQLIGRLESWLSRTGCLHGVVGHFHVPYAIKRKGRAGRIFCLKSWDEPNLLTFDGESFARISLASRPSAPQ